MTREPDTILQPSLHSLEDFVGMLLDEAECRQVNVKDLQDEYNQLETLDEGKLDILYDIDLDIQDRLSDAGYANDTIEDVFVIMAKDEELPDDWLE